MALGRKKEDDQERRIRLAYERAAKKYSKALVKLESKSNDRSKPSYIAAFGRAEIARRALEPAKLALELYRVSQLPGSTGTQDTTDRTVPGDLSHPSSSRTPAIRRLYVG